MTGQAVSPDGWAIAASTLPLAFAQVREDPLLDLELASALPEGARVVMIASGGDTAAVLGRLPLHIHVADINPAQLALTRLKWHLAEKRDLRESSAILGHRPLDPDTRAEKLAAILSSLGLPPDILGPMEVVSRLGPDHAGRYEVTFAELRARLAPWRPELLAALESAVPLPGFAETELGMAVAQAFREVMSLENLVCLFGEGATRNPRRAFSDHFAWRTAHAISRAGPARNPFLWQILAGTFPAERCYTWLTSHHGRGEAIRGNLTWQQGEMSAVLAGQPPESAHLVHLSNVLDWLSPDEARTVLDRARRVLVPGGRVIIRQLNSTLDIPAIDAGLAWDRAAGEEMEARDRSYFYPQLHLGTCPA